MVHNKTLKELRKRNTCILVCTLYVMICLCPATLIRSLTLNMCQPCSISTAISRAVHMFTE